MHLSLLLPRAFSPGRFFWTASFSSGFLRLDSCTDSDLWMYGSFRRPGDLLVLCDFRVIFGTIFGSFRSSLDS